MPRPDLEALGINYRRIPIVAIGKDVYCDTLLILDKLERLFPSGGKNGTLGGRTGEQRAMEKLLEKWTDVVVFPHAAACIPVDHPLVQDPKFIKDRTELWGESWEPSHRQSKRAEGLVNMRALFDFLETTLLSDGREWALGNEGPTLADIHCKCACVRAALKDYPLTLTQAAWIFNWMMSLDGSFPQDMVSQQTHPKTIAWCERYNKAVTAAVEAAKPEVVDVAEVLKRLAQASFAEKPSGVDIVDPLGLKEGEIVTVAPIDTGFTVSETGPLLAITAEEIVIGSKTKDGTEVHVHSPRFNFRVKPAST